MEMQLEHSVYENIEGTAWLDQNKNYENEEKKKKTTSFWHFITSSGEERKGNVADFVLVSSAFI